MDEHKLRLRFENGLSTSRGENLVRRLNKKLRTLVYSASPKDRLEAGHGLLRDQETIRELLLVQQLRAQKVAKQSTESTGDAEEKRRAALETELKRKREVYEELTAKLPKLEGKGRTEGRELLLPVSTCEAQLTQLQKKEAELDGLIQQQGRDFLKWKEMAAAVEKTLQDASPADAPPATEKSPESPSTDVEPKPK